MEFGKGGLAQSISVDASNNVFYWANYDANAKNYKVIRTSYNGESTSLNITYSGEIELTSDVFNFYVYDKRNARIDIYSKRTLERHSNFSIDLKDFVIGYGKFFFCAL